MHTRTLIAAVAVAAAGTCASTTQASLVGTSFTATITHDGVAGGLVGPAVINHTYAAPNIFNNMFFGSFILASPTAAPGFDNAILLDFSLFNYSGFAVPPSNGTIVLTSLDENVAPGSVAVFAGSIGMGPNIGFNISGAGDTLTASWGAASVFTPSPTTPDSMVVAWNSVVPAPGALALLGMAGLVAGRRRRRS